jgi:anti-anti-sigma regulatory factor
MRSSSMGVSVHSRPTASATILVISGELDTASAEVFQESLSALITIRRLVGARDCELRITSASKAVRTIVNVMDMQHVLDEVPRAFASRRAG